MTHKVHAVKKAKVPPIKINAQRVQEIASARGVSAAFVTKIIKTEGLRRTPYKIAGANTIGIGHNMDADPKFRGKKGVVLSESQVYDIFAQDLLKAEEKVNGYTNNMFKRLTQNQKEVVLDNSFNRKPETFRDSYLVKAITEGRFEDAVMGINTVASGKKVLLGLCYRSLDNIEHYAKGQQPDKAKMAIDNIIEKCGSGDGIVMAGQKAKDNLEMAWVLKEPPPQKPFTASNP